MPRTPETASTPWRQGFFKAQLGQLGFGQTYEDSTIELEAFGPRSRVFCIAGAGYTARALAAAGHQVTAVDINPVQLSYARSRAAGGPLRRGIAERVLALGRNLAKLAGWSRGTVQDFLNLSDTSEQVEYWDRRLDTQAWRSVVDLCSLHACSAYAVPARSSNRCHKTSGYGFACVCDARGPHIPTEAIRMLLPYC